ncbi:MAG: VWA domain-containing protein [Vicinamibacterales bacterium]
MRIRATAAIVVLTVQTVLADQSPPQQAQPKTESYSAGVTAVLVDVVVRDKRGRPVLDLTADDFEVFEDSTRQRIGSFSVVERAGGIGIKVGRRISGPAPADGRSTSAPAAASEPDRPTVAIVFDALQPEALALAQKAALSYLPMSGDTDARIGVFASEPGLRVLQPYTDDLPRVRRAINRVTTAGTAQQEVEAARRQVLNQRLVELDALGLGRETTTFGPDGANAGQAQAIVERQMTELEMRMLRTFESLDRDQRGFGSADALLAIVQSLAPLPGRKTLVYLSEGLPASPAMQARLDGLVSSANRANVSVYTIDAAGLRAESTLSETRRELDAASQERLRQNSISRDPSNGPITRIVERTEDMLRLDPQTGLARLAGDTGGFLIRDTNDLGSAFRRIDEDNRFHYLLTYSPSNVEYDGKFRTIAVKVKRDGSQVFARKGYLAVRPVAVPFLGYEVAALKALGRATPAKDFPITASGFVFPHSTGSAAVPIVVQVKTRELEFKVDHDKSTYAAQATVLARIKNAAGQSVHTLSQQYLLTGASKDVDTAREGEILFYRQPELQPGVYTLEAIVHDAVGERASVRFSTITVPAGTGAATPSSTLVIVRRTETVAAADRPANLPFYYGDLLLYPNAGDPLKHGRDAELTFYFWFYRGSTTNPSASLELLHSGRPLASVPVDFAHSLPEGRNQHVGKLPIDKFPAGTYELRLRLRTGADEQLRSAFFTIVE